MKIKTILAAASILAVAFTSAQAQTTGSGTSANPYVVNLTGATAFRSAATSAIRALLGGNGVTQYAWVDASPTSTGVSRANRSIFKGTINDVHYIVRCSWSGSTQGILDLADQNNVEVLSTSTAMSTGGTLVTSPSYVSVKPSWSFSDVDKLLSQRPNATLSGGPVGVVPFMFVAGKGSVGLTNMTDQLHNALWSLGQMQASMFGVTGLAAATTVLATGRNDGSGTRATILAETGYGAFTRVVQFQAVTAAGPNQGEISLFESSGNGGNSSNSGVSDLLVLDKNILKFGGQAVDAVFVSYLTISDAVAATGYNQANGTISGGQGAIPMTYNGVRYSEANVQNGAYTLWGYQQLYLKPNASAAELTFDTALRAGIPNSMGTAGLAISTMNVNRVGGDGGLVLPK
jgi:hypothetical protein